MVYLELQEFSHLYRLSSPLEVAAISLLVCTRSSTCLKIINCRRSLKRTRSMSLLPCTTQRWISLKLRLFWMKLDYLAMLLPTLLLGQRFWSRYVGHLSPLRRRTQIVWYSNFPLWIRCIFIEDSCSSLT